MYGGEVLTPFYEETSIKAVTTASAVHVTFPLTSLALSNKLKRIPLI